MRVVSVGIDVGGTFTDLLAIDADGGAQWRKVPSTPQDQSDGILEVLAALGEQPARIGRIVHGTTVATNMLLERTGSRVVLCATEGATDLLELRRQDRASLYDLTKHHPRPLVDRRDVVGVEERVAPEGIVEPLRPAGLARAVERVAALGPETIAVTLLHSYASPGHERMVVEALRERLGREVVVVASHEVLPEIREYERAATTVAEAYLRPGVGRYLERLSERMSAAGYRPPAVMTSAGGMRGAPAAARSGAALALSGPAGGMVGAAALARRVGLTQALTIDVGGTSADAGLILGGEALVEPGGDVAGVPIALPRTLIETVSAGGGSIAWMDSGRALRVGPRSAGALPGPASYGRGGTEPTVTDAHLVLGHIGEDVIGEGVKLNEALAREAIQRLARQLGADTAHTARAILATAEAEIARALRRVSVERGIDPRSCALIAFGGAGPLHACALADRIGAREVYVPPFAGVLSALGLAIAPWRSEAAVSVMRRANSLHEDTVRVIMDSLAKEAASSQRGDERWWARARFVGQGHELDVEVERGFDGKRIAAELWAAHFRRTRFALDHEVEIVSMRCAVTGATMAPPVTTERPGEIRGPAAAPLANSALVVPRDWVADPARHGGYHLHRVL